MRIKKHALYLSCIALVSLGIVLVGGCGQGVDAVSSSEKNPATVENSGHSDIRPPATMVAPQPGFYNTPVEVILTCAVPDQSPNECEGVYYSDVAGVSPESYKKYEAPLKVVGHLNIEFYSVDKKGNKENVMTASYTIDADKPVTSTNIQDELFTEPTSVLLTCADGASGSGCKSILYSISNVDGATGYLPFGGSIDIPKSSVLSYYSVDNLGNTEDVRRVSITISPIVSVASGAEHSIVLLANGQVLAWGANSNYQLGDGTNISRTKPRLVYTSDNTPLSNVVSLDAGYFHNLALKSDGTVWAWGKNDFGQLSSGDTSINKFAVPAFGLPGAASAVEAGANHSMAILKSDGSVVAWGRNEAGQLGNKTFSTYASAGKVVDALGSAVTGVSKLTSLGDHTLALRGPADAILSWGRNVEGQLADGTSNNRNWADTVLYVDATSLLYRLDFSNPPHTLDSKPSVGLGGPPRNKVSSIEFGTPTVRASLGSASGPLLVFNPQPSSPTSLQYDQIQLNVSDLPSSSNYCFTSDIIVDASSGSGSFTILFDAPDVRTIDFKSDGTIVPWVFRASGLGSGTFSKGQVLSLIANIDLVNDTWQISVGNSTLTTSSFGGAIKMESIRFSAQSTDVANLFKVGVDNVKLYASACSGIDARKPLVAKQVSAGETHSLAIQSDLTLWMWGAVPSGQVGLPSSTINLFSTKFTLPNAISIADSTIAYAGRNNNFLATLGGVYVWGNNADGMLGDGSSLFQPQPVMVTDDQFNGLTNLQTMAIGPNHALALSPASMLWGWGSNKNGQLRDTNSVAFQRAKPIHLLP